jgi:hypothetical protein
MINEIRLSATDTEETRIGHLALGPLPVTNAMLSAQKN